MADSKISALAAASSLAITDELVIASSGASKKIAAGVLPGYELNYTQFTSTVNITATSDATADTIVTAGAVTFDGSTVAIIEFFSPAITVEDTSAAITALNLYDGSTDLGRLFLLSTVAAVQQVAGALIRRRLTPSAAAHTYSIRGWSTVATANAQVQGGGGGTATNLPGYIRITRA